MKKLLSIVLILSLLVVQPIQVHADESKILTLGANLTEEQKQLVIDYLNVDINNVVVIEVTNEEEHALLDGIATQQQIGTRTYSCCYIEPTNFGGIHIKTVNLSWVTCEMIRNALVTSGITNCNVICMSPIEVSGTGALTGIFKAYENISGVEITEENKELASEELITTCTIAGTIGQEEASTLMSELKEKIITNEITSSEKIEETVQNYLSSRNMELTEEDFWKLVELLTKLSEKDYDIEEIKQAYADIKQTASEIKEATDKTVGFFEGVLNWLKGAWNWITGKAKEIEESEQLEAIKNSMGILAETDDSLLSDTTIVTNTVEDEVIEEISGTKPSEDDTSEGKGHWYDFILEWFNAGNKKNKPNNNTEEENTENSLEDTEEQADDTEETKLNFDSFESEAEEYQEELEENMEQEEKKDGLLQYIKTDFDNTSESSNNENATNSQEIQSFDDLTNK